MEEGRLVRQRGKLRVTGKRGDAASLWSDRQWDSWVEGGPEASKHYAKHFGFHLGSEEVCSLDLGKNV